MIEYWLQKKTIGGWSHVTWYSSEAEALLNMQRAASGNSGYSWRVMKAEVVRESLLNDHQEVMPASTGFKDITPEQVGKAFSGDAWGEAQAAAVNNNPWEASATSVAPAAEKFKTDNRGAKAGTVWMLNHKKKLRARVPEASIEQYRAEGYEFGGPKTAFRG